MSVLDKLERWTHWTHGAHRYTNLIIVLLPWVVGVLLITLLLVCGGGK